MFAIHNLKPNNMILTEKTMYDSIPDSKSNPDLKIKVFNIQSKEASYRQSNIICNLYNPIDPDEIQTERNLPTFQVTKNIFCIYVISKKEMPEHIITEIFRLIL